MDLLLNNTLKQECRTGSTKRKFLARDEIDAALSASVFLAGRPDGIHYLWRYSATGVGAGSFAASKYSSLLTSYTVGAYKLLSSLACFLDLHGQPITLQSSRQSSPSHCSESPFTWESITPEFKLIASS